MISTIMLSCSSDSDPPEGDDDPTPAADEGDVEGMVTDQDGNVYDNVRITLKEGTTTVRIVSTQNTGIYNFADVSVGSYNVEIELPLSTAIVGSDSQSVSVQKNATANADFTVNPMAIEGDLVLGAGDILGETLGGQQCHHPRKVQPWALLT